jgi:hypothetical protein
MGYLPQFKNDIFISYRRASNEGEDRWVDAFCDRLRARLADLVGDITIWRDSAAIRAGDQWRPEIAEALDNAAIFLAIISRTYFDSDVCRAELDRFLGCAKEAAEAMQRRIVPIFKQPTKPDQELPQELAEIHHHDFFQPGPLGSNHFREFSPGKDEETALRFWETLEQLAQDLMDALETLKGRARARAAGTVYLARVGPELHAERAKLRSDLQQRGYLVVPECEYLWNAADFQERIGRDLDAALLCVHQVARTASIEPKTAGRARLQLELAAQAMTRKAKPPPLVWIQPANNTDDGARALIDYIERDLSNSGVEYCQGSLEDFKTQIYDKLPSRDPAPAAVVPVREVALVVEEGDVSATGEITAFLVDKLGLEPRRIKFSGSAPRDPSSLARTLARCRKCIIFWGAQSEEWVSDLLTLEGLGAYASKEGLCVYGAAPASPEKSTFRTNRARTIPAASDVAEADLRRFLGATETG